MTIRVGITGGIGSGKTTICKIFETLGVPVYYADNRAKHLMTFDRQLKERIKNEFGKDVYHSNGRLNRQALAKIVFTNKSKLDKLNQIVHPAVGKDSKKWFEKIKTKYAIKEAALMIESGSHKSLDKLIVVLADEVIRINRVTKRDKSSEEQIKQRIKNQISDVERLKYADFKIFNNGDLSLIQQVIDIHKELNKSVTRS